MTATNHPLPRGRCLENDFRRLIDDERLHDIALKCSDGKTIHGCKAILATRSRVFNSSIFSESARNNKLSYDDINSTAMKIILEFLYTSKVKNLTVDIVVEAYYASIHFKLTCLQYYIIKFTIEKLKKDEDMSKKLLSEYVEKFLDDDNLMSLILILFVSTSKLEKIGNDSLSLKGLKYLLEKTCGTEFPFSTPEFNIWEYALTKAIRKVIQNETEIKRILNEKSFSMCKIQEIKKIKNYLNPLTDYINLERMDPEEIKQHVEPFDIYPTQKVKNAYRSIALNEELEYIRGTLIFKWKNNQKMKYGENTIFTSDIVSNYGPPKSISGDLIFKGRGVYEWKVSIEKMRKTIYIGICDVHEDLNKTDQKYHGWVLGSDGYVYHNNEWKWYDAKFKEGDKVTVHLNMKMKTCAFSINDDNKKPIVSQWKNIPSQVRPIVSLGHGSKLRLEPSIDKCLDLFFHVAYS